MIDNHLCSVDELDFILKTKLKDGIRNIDGYIFEGDDYNRINFDRLLAFYDDELFKIAGFNIRPVDRWVNAYYWYAVYIFELKRQSISTENHGQAKFKLIEQIDYAAEASFDWTIIEKIENEFG